MQEICHSSYVFAPGPPAWRRGWDSNPRNLAALRFSRPAQSTTLPPLQFTASRHTRCFLQSARGAHSVQAGGGSTTAPAASTASRLTVGDGTKADSGLQRKSGENGGKCWRGMFDEPELALRVVDEGERIEALKEARSNPAWEYLHGKLLGYSDENIALYLRKHPLRDFGQKVLDAARSEAAKFPEAANASARQLALGTTPLRVGKTFGEGNPELLKSDATLKEPIPLAMPIFQAAKKVRAMIHDGPLEFFSTTAVNVAKGPTKFKFAPGPNESWQAYYEHLVRPTQGETRLATGGRSPPRASMLGRCPCGRRCRNRSSASSTRKRRTPFSPGSITTARFTLSSPRPGRAGWSRSSCSTMRMPAATWTTACPARGPPGSKTGRRPARGRPPPLCPGRSALTLPAQQNHTPPRFDPNNRAIGPLLFPLGQWRLILASRGMACLTALRGAQTIAPGKRACKGRMCPVGRCLWRCGSPSRHWR